MASYYHNILSSPDVSTWSTTGGPINNAISLPLGSYVLGGNHIFLEMSAIQSAAGLPRFCGERRLSKGRIDRHSGAQRSTWRLEEPLES